MDWLMIAGVVVVVLVQWPLWVLSSKDFVLSMVLPYFSGEVMSLNGCHLAVGVVVLLVPLTGVALLLRSRARQRGVEDVAPDA